MRYESWVKFVSFFFEAGKAQVPERDSCRHDQDIPKRVVLMK